MLKIYMKKWQNKIQFRFGFTFGDEYDEDGGEKLKKNKISSLLYCVL